MLNKINRINTNGDFRAIMRKGRKVTTADAFLHITKTNAPTRFGFIVSKSVGNAAHRNLAKRRLREVAAEVIKAKPTGLDVVIRARENASATEYSILKADIFKSLL